MRYEASHVSNICSGGTEVTVNGSHLNSVAKPRITLTVVTSRANNDRSSTSDSGVIEQFVHLLYICISLQLISTEVTI